MVPRSGKNGLPTPKRVWVWSREIAVRTVIEIYRGCALAIDDEQFAMVDHALRHRFVVESKPRGFLVLLGGVASRKDLLEAFNETEVTVLYRGGRQARARRGCILDLANQFEELLVFRNADVFHIWILAGHARNQEWPAQERNDEKASVENSHSTHGFSLSFLRSLRRARPEDFSPATAALRSSHVYSKGC